MAEYDAKQLAQDLAKGMGVKRLKEKYGQEVLNDAGLGEMRRNWAYSYRGENLAFLETSVKLDNDIDGLEGILEAVEGMNPSKRVVQYETVRKGLVTLSETLEDYIRISYDGEVDDEEVERAMEDLSHDPAFASYIHESAAGVVEPESLVVLPEIAIQSFDGDPLDSFEGHSTDQDLLSTEEDLGGSEQTLRTSIEYDEAEEPSLDLEVFDPDSILGEEDTTIDGLEEVVDSPDDYIASPVWMGRSVEERSSDYIEAEVDSWIFHMSKADDPNACLAEKLDRIKGHPYADEYFATLVAKINLNRDLFPKRNNLLGAFAGLEDHGEYVDVTGLPVVPTVLERKDYSGWKRVAHIAGSIATAGLVVVVGGLSLLVPKMLAYNDSLDEELKQNLEEHYEQRNAISEPRIPLVDLVDDGEALVQAVQETTREISLKADRFWDETLPTVVGVDEKSVTSNVENHDYVIIDRNGETRLPSQQLAMNLNGLPMATNDPSAGCPLPMMLIPQGDGLHMCGGEKEIHQYYNRETLERAIAERLGIGFGGDAIADSESGSRETS